MSNKEIAQGMTRNYDQRLLQLVPLWYWKDAFTDRGSRHVYLQVDWNNPKTKKIWGISWTDRIAFTAETAQEALEARDELRGMVRAARLLARV